MTVGVTSGVTEARIRVTVSYVAPKASAKAQGIQASAVVVKGATAPSMTKLTSMVQYVIPAAALKFVNIVLNAELDPIGRNPIVSDIFVVADTASLGLLKPFYEVQPVTDAKVLVFRKGLTETKITTDTRTFSLSRSIADLVAVTDDFQGNANIDDDQVMVFSKALSVEQQTVSDSASTAFGKRATDSAATADQKSFAIGKALTDAPIFVDVKTVAYSKALADMVDAGDEFNAVALTDDGEVMIFGKSLSDAFTVADSSVNLVGKAASDSATVGDELLPFDLGKGITDNPLISEAQAFDTSKPLTDATATSEARVVSQGKNIADRLYYPAEGPNQYDTYALTYFAQDYVREGFPAISFGKALLDTVVSTDDFYGVANADDDETMLFNKGLADSATASETLTRSSSKPLADAATTSDALTSATAKPLADSVSKSDTVAKGPSKALSDAIASSEIVVRSAGKALSDNPATADNRTFALSKSLLDSVQSTDDFLGNANADDDETMAFTKVLSDGVSKSDSTVKTAGKGLTESVSSSESGSLVWTDYWDITYTVTTSGVYVGTSRTF